LINILVNKVSTFPKTVIDNMHFLVHDYIYVP
jgi:hypothetical protein